MLRNFRQVDVFGVQHYKGNPVGVVLDAMGLSDDDLRDYSVWSNLSECTFVYPPSTGQADYRFRIFSLSTELPFAGHPTLGTARAWLDQGGAPRQQGLIIAECEAGLVPIRIEEDLLSFVSPPATRTGDVEPGYLAQVIEILGVAADSVLAAQWMDNGPGWVGLQLADAATVLELAPNAAGHPGNWNIGVIGALEPGESPTGEDFEVRTFFTEDGFDMREDPVTGSFNAAAAAWMLDTDRARAPYSVRQGTAMDRRGRLEISVADGKVWVGGATHVAIAGQIDL